MHRGGGRARAVYSGMGRGVYWSGSGAYIEVVGGRGVYRVGVEQGCIMGWVQGRILRWLG